MTDCANERTSVCISTRIPEHDADAPRTPTIHPPTLPAGVEAEAAAASSVDIFTGELFFHPKGELRVRFFKTKKFVWCLRGCQAIRNFYWLITRGFLNVEAIDQ